MKKRQHVAVVHTKCRDLNCMICEGGLFLCAVCGGAEGSLLPECPGRMLTADEDAANYQHYIKATGPFKGDDR